MKRDTLEMQLMAWLLDMLEWTSVAIRRFDKQNGFEFGVGAADAKGC